MSLSDRAREAIKRLGISEKEAAVLAKSQDEKADWTKPLPLAEPTAPKIKYRDCQRCSAPAHPVDGRCWYCGCELEPKEETEYVYRGGVSVKDPASYYF